MISHLLLLSGARSILVSPGPSWRMLQKAAPSLQLMMSHLPFSYCGCLTPFVADACDGQAIEELWRASPDGSTMVNDACSSLFGAKPCHVSSPGAARSRGSTPRRQWQDDCEMTSRWIGAGLSRDK